MPLRNLVGEVEMWTKEGEALELLKTDRDYILYSHGTLLLGTARKSIDQQADAYELTYIDGQL